MWSRAELKERAKMALKANYWRTILVTLIVFLIGGSSTTINYNLDEGDLSVDGILDQLLEDNDVVNQFNDALLITGDKNYSDQYGSGENSDEYVEGYYDGYRGNAQKTDDPGDYSDGYVDGALDAYYENKYMEDGDISLEDNDTDLLEAILDGDFLSRIGMVAGVVVIIALVVAAVGTAVSIFIFGPLDVGTKRFFVKNLNEAGELKEVLFIFDHAYMNVVKIMFIRSLCTFGWTLLFVIPGIVKSYEYMMIPYLLAENPNLSKEQAFALSKQMMSGNKWNAFILEWSFIGWDILAGFTLGILNIFYVQPYKCMTYAALYEELSLINGRPAFAGQADQDYYQSNPYMYGQNTYESQTDTSGTAYYAPNDEEM